MTKPLEAINDSNRVVPNPCDESVYRDNNNAIRMHIDTINDAVGDIDDTLTADLGKVKVNSGDTLDFLNVQFAVLNDPAQFAAAIDLIVEAEVESSKMRLFVDSSAITDYNVAKDMHLMAVSGALKWVEVDSAVVVPVTSKPAYFSCDMSTQQAVSNVNGDPLKFDTTLLDSDSDYSTSVWSLDTDGADEGELTISRSAKFWVTVNLHVDTTQSGPSFVESTEFWVERYRDSAWTIMEGSGGHAIFTWILSQPYHTDAAMNSSFLVDVESGDKYRVVATAAHNSSGGAQADYLAAAAPDNCYWAWHEIHHS
jgi:hypothetical protein